MPKYLVLRDCWSDVESPGNHRMYKEGTIALLPKDIKDVPRHLVLVKQDEDGNIEVVGKVETRKDASAKMAAKENAAASEVIKKATGTAPQGSIFKGK